MPNRVALFWEGLNGRSEKFTFRELDNLSNQFANLLKGLGIGRNDRVFVLLPRVPELYISTLGILKAGAICGTLLTDLGPDAIHHRLWDSGAKVLIVDRPNCEKLKRLPSKLPELKHVIVVGPKEVGRFEQIESINFWQEIDKAPTKFEAIATSPNDICFFIYTSGTTGFAKGVICCHSMALSLKYTTLHVLDLKPEDMFWCTSDPGWVTGICYGMFGPWLAGNAVLSYQGEFNPQRWYKVLEKYQVTNWYTTPTLLRMLMRQGEELPKRYDLSLRRIGSVGEPLNPEVIGWSKRVFGVEVHDTYWQTETGSIVIANYGKAPIKPGSMGRAVPGIQAAIIDEEGNALPAHEVGEIALVPNFPSFFKGYWNKPSSTRKCFRNGWYVTHDRAYMDQEGYFWFIGRSDDVIKSGALCISPFEVENALLRHPAVAEAVVVGKPDELQNQVVKAFVTLRHGYKPSRRLSAEIKAFVREHLAEHAQPREIEFRSELPKTRSGKIQRKLLREGEMGQV